MSQWLAPLKDASHGLSPPLSFKLPALFFFLSIIIVHEFPPLGPNFLFFFFSFYIISFSGVTRVVLS